MAAILAAALVGAIGLVERVTDAAMGGGREAGACDASRPAARAGEVGALQRRSPAFAARVPEAGGGCALAPSWPGGARVARGEPSPAPLAALDPVRLRQGAA